MGKMYHGISSFSEMTPGDWVVTDCNPGQVSIGIGPFDKHCMFIYTPRGDDGKQMPALLRDLATKLNATAAEIEQREETNGNH